MNPTGQPQSFGQPPPSGGSAKDALNIPSLLILIFAAIGILVQLSQLAGLGGVNNLPPELMNNPQLAKFMAQAQSGGKLGNVVGLLLSGLTVFGALQMRQVKNFPLSMAAAILSMLPCGSCCCCITLPIGIWALVTMNKPEIKSQFT